MNLKKMFHVDNDNLAVPEIHSEGYDELQDKADEEDHERKKKENISKVPMSIKTARN